MPMHVFGGTNYIRNDGHVPRILNLSSDFASNLVENFYSNLSECYAMTGTIIMIEDLFLDH